MLILDCGINRFGGRGYGKATRATYNGHWFYLLCICGLFGTCTLSSAYTHNPDVQ